MAQGVSSRWVSGVWVMWMVCGWVQGLCSNTLGRTGACTEHRAVCMERSCGLRDISGQNQQGLGRPEGQRGVHSNASASSLGTWEDQSVVREGQDWRRRRRGPFWTWWCEGPMAGDLGGSWGG